MRVEILKLGSGPEGSHKPGQEVEVSEREGRDLIADRAARELPPLPKPIAGPTEAEREAAAVLGATETATAPRAPERAVTKRPRKGGRS